MSTYQKEYRESKKDGLHHVYLINEYAGVTDTPYYRKIWHKHKGRDVSNFRVIYSTADRQEALELEALLHTIGYSGKNPGYKGRVYKELTTGYTGTVTQMAKRFNMNTGCIHIHGKRGTPIKLGRNKGLHFTIQSSPS